MKKIIFIFLSLLMLNHSVDLDYIAAGTRNFDDIDSVWEMLIEKITGDSGFTSESAEDHGLASAKPTESFISCVFTDELFNPRQSLYDFATDRHGPVDYAGPGYISKVHLSVFTPPPDLNL